MDRAEFKTRLRRLLHQQEELIVRPNTMIESSNGIFYRYRNPVLTAAHAPVFWRYDLTYERNPYLLERLGINATFNSGAMEFNGKIVLAVRVGRQRSKIILCHRRERKRH
jgi:4-O-beta-D-mannosyl-D-glucose phosphorylase